MVFIVRESFKDDFKKLYDKRLSGKIELAYVCQELHKIPSDYLVDPERIKPWGTGHAVLMAKEVVEGNFVVINGDDFYGKEAFKTIIKALDLLDSSTLDMCMVGYNLENTISANGSVSRGECFINEQRELTTIIERTKIEKIAGTIQRNDKDGKSVSMSEDTIVSMNFWGFTPRFLEVLEKEFALFLKVHSSALKSEFYIPTVVNNIIASKKGRVKVLTSDAKWMGVTYAADKPQVVKEIKNLKRLGIYSKELWL